MKKILFIYNFEDYSEILRQKLIATDEISIVELLEDEVNWVEFCYNKYAELNTTCVEDLVAEFNKDKINDRSRNLEYLEHKNGSFYARFRIFSQLCLEVCNKYRSEIDQLRISSERCNVNKALDAITAKSLYLLNSVICLIENGYSDAAQIILRTIIEHSVVSTILLNNSDSVSAEFINSINQKKENEQYKWKWAEKIELSEEEKKEFPDTSDKVELNSISRLMKLAYIYTNKNKEANISYTRFSKVYNFSSNFVHANAKAVFARLESDDQYSYLNTGPTEVGFDYIMINCMKYTFNIISDFFAQNITIYALVGLSILRNWIETTEAELQNKP